MECQILFSGENEKNIIVLFLHKNLCCGYSLEVPHLGICFSWKNKKIFGFSLATVNQQRSACMETN